MFVLGTAGHVDHGKSSLLRALTGLEADRLPEEKRRGMTIELNFVWLQSEVFGRVGIVDVPGHQRFVKNMVSGVVSLDAFLFVVAADDGWMPQSEEHLNILKALRVQHGLVVLTKSDLVSAEHLAEVETQVREKFLAAGFCSIAVLPFSIHQPVTKVRAEIEAMVKQLPPPRVSGSGRLWVDRVFTPRGLGVVATGTLRDGSLKNGDTLWVWPSQKTGVVKSLQAYGESKTDISPVSRVAVQLSDVGVAGVDRGSLLCKERPRLTGHFEAQVQFWKKVPSRNFSATFHFGTGKSGALVIPLGDIEGVGQGCRIKLGEPWPLRPGDRFLLRAAGEERTIGAGIVVEIAPPKETKAQACERLKIFNDSAEGWRAYLWAKGAILDREEFQYSIYPTCDTEEKLCDSTSVAPTRSLNSRLLLRHGDWNKVKTTLGPTLMREAPAKRKGFSAAEIGTLIEAVLNLGGTSGVPAFWLKPFLDALVVEGVLVWNGEGYWPKDLKREVTVEEGRWRDEILKLLKAGNSGPVSLVPWFNGDKSKRDLAHLMAREGSLAALGEGFFLEAVVLTQHRDRVKGFLIQNGTGSTKDLRDFLGLAREKTVMILEKFDGEGLTYFKDNVRRLF